MLRITEGEPALAEAEAAEPAEAVSRAFQGQRPHEPKSRAPKKGIVWGFYMGSLFESYQAVYDKF